MKYKLTETDFFKRKELEKNCGCKVEQEKQKKIDI
jgi:hypothetical protein